MATITLYNMNKKQNSTALPTGAGNVRTGEFNQPLDLLNPSITIEGPSSLIAGGYNYAYVPSMRRYYWITGITVLSDRLAEISLAVDVLATYKTEIGNSSHYVLRSSNMFNNTITDHLYPIKAEKTCVTTSIPSIPWYNPNGYVLADGWYIIGVNNDDINAVGSTSFYAMNEQAFQSLRNSLFSSVGWTGMSFSPQEISEPLYKSLFNPMQYIVSCMWFPVQPDLSGATSVTSINMGFFPAPAFSKTGSLCYKLNALLKGGEIDLTVQTHPMAATRGRYLNEQPFFTRTLYIPVVGSIELDTSKIHGTNAKPALYWYIDYVSGECRIRVTCPQNDNAIIGDAVGQLGLNVSLAQQTQDVLGFGAGVLTAAGGGMTAIFGSVLGDANMALTGIQGVASGITSAASALAPNVTALPGRAALINGDIIPYDIVSYVDPVDDDNADRGRPLCEVQQMSNIPGYILCADANITINRALRPEQDMIIQYLNTGFFYE